MVLGLVQTVIFMTRIRVTAQKKILIAFSVKLCIVRQFSPIICMRIYAEVEKKRLGNKEKRQEIFLAAGMAA